MCACCFTTSSSSSSSYVHSSNFSRDDSAASIRGVMQSYPADPSVEYGGATWMP